MKNNITTTTIVERTAWQDFHLWCVSHNTNRSRMIRNLVVWILNDQIVIPQELFEKDDGSYDYENQYSIQKS